MISNRPVDILWLFCGTTTKTEEETMRKSCRIWVTTATSIAALFVAGSAFAAQNVANTSQKGSLLIWPLITVDQSNGASGDTLIEISNDANVGVHVECEYVNERKGRVNFDFAMS